MLAEKLATKEEWAEEDEVGLGCRGGALEFGVGARGLVCGVGTSGLLDGGLGS